MRLRTTTRPAIRSTKLFAGGLLFFTALAPCFAVPARQPVVTNPLAESERLVMQGRVNDAVSKLRGLIAENPRNAQAHLLLCRAFYSEQLADQAVGECEAALVDLSGDSQAQDWMGRAYGLMANNAGPFTGLKLAIKVKEAFEAAVALDPQNKDAVNDAAEYYVGAPAIVGGGIDRASALANRVQNQLPQMADRIRALVAQKQHNYGTAEREFKAAVAQGGTPDAWVDLGHFYQRRGETAQAVDALRHAIAADGNHGPDLVDVASILIAMNTDLGTAQQALQSYLASNDKSDAAPAFRAHFELGQVLAAKGDKQSARSEFENALNLARDYSPAQKALRNL
jgi:tetratricopeptide (TPR) repeat protein